jgi:hypothetical protein
MSSETQPAAPAPSNPIQDVENWFKNFVTSAESFFTGTVWPFVKTLFLSIVESELAMIQPLAERAAQEVESQLGTAFTNTGDFIKFVNGVVANLLQKVEANALQVAESTIMTAAQAAVANLLASKSA